MLLQSIVCRNFYMFMGPCRLANTSTGGHEDSVFPLIILFLRALDCLEVTAML